MFHEFSARAQKEFQQEFGGAVHSVEWTRPDSVAHGDLSTSIALQLSKKLGKNPRDIATKFAELLTNDPSVEKVEVAGAGYVNVWLSSEALLQELTYTQAATVATPTRKKEAPVIVEYSQPNIAKPLGIHHLIGTAVGQAVANLYAHAGFPVIRWNYIGDWGTQFGKLAVAYQKWGKGKPVSEHSVTELLELYVKFHDEVEKDKSLEDEGREASRQLEAGDSGLREFWKDVVTVTKAALVDVYKRLHVSFDLDLGESFYEDKMESVLTEGKKKKVFTEGEGGALIVQFAEDSNLPPYLVLRGDGATLYSTRDLAQMRYRIDTYNPQEILIFTDIAQKLHFEQLEATCKLLGWQLPKFENVLFGRMRFVDSSMSTRKGNILNLEQVLDEAVKRADEIIAARGESIQTDDPKGLAEMIGVGALVYGILSQNRKMDLVFDWEKMLSFDGNSAPYLQYTHARACSVLRKSEAADFSLPRSAQVFTQGERTLLTLLLQFPQVLDEARTMHMPHKLATYLFSLCQEFNAFYNSEPILKAEDDKRPLRLALTSIVAQVLKTGAELLTLRVPERM